jgi:large subunit ribosomal protein L17
MRHRAQSKRFGKSPTHRKVLYNQLATSLIEHGRIRTTLKRAKAVRGLVDNLIGYAKKDTLQAKRMARTVITNRVAFKRLFSEHKEAFLKLPNEGGYSRIFKTGFRRGDNAPMALMELLDFIPKIKTEKGTEKTKEAAPAKKKKIEKTEKIKKEALKKAPKKAKSKA